MRGGDTEVGVPSGKTKRPKDGTTTFIFGSAKITGARPTAAQISRSAATSAEGLERAAARLMKPGVHIPRKRNVASYHVEPDSPGIYVRVLNGRQTRGSFADGVFLPFE